jgi:hypothetical protein
MNVDGLIFMLNQAGIALSEAQQEIARLGKENDALKALVEKKKP